MYMHVHVHAFIKDVLSLFLRSVRSQVFSNIILISSLTDRAPRSTNKLSYSYQLSGLTSDPTMGDAYQPMMTTFCHMRVEDYNWNYLDQHICGHSDFEELGEVRVGGEKLRGGGKGEGGW